MERGDRVGPHIRAGEQRVAAAETVADAGPLAVALGQRQHVVAHALDIALSLFVIEARRAVDRFRERVFVAHVQRTGGRAEEHVEREREVAVGGEHLDGVARDLADAEHRRHDDDGRRRKRVRVRRVRRHFGGAADGDRDVSSCVRHAASFRSAGRDYCRKIAARGEDARMSRYLHTSIFVNDMAASIDFYTNKLGLKLLGGPNHYPGNADMAFVGIDWNAYIELVYDLEDHPPYALGNRYEHLALEVDGDMEG